VEAWRFYWVLRCHSNAFHALAYHQKVELMCSSYPYRLWISCAPMARWGNRWQFYKGCLLVASFSCDKAVAFFFCQDLSYYQGHQDCSNLDYFAMARLLDPSYCRCCGRALQNFRSYNAYLTHCVWLFWGCLQAFYPSSLRAWSTW